MIVLPAGVRERAVFRILVMPEGQWTTGGTGGVEQPWELLPMPQILARPTLERFSGTVAQGGYHLRRITRWTLPDEDRAEFYIDTGAINGIEVDERDLSNHAVRIQVWDDEAAPGVYTQLPSGDDAWKTVFVGTVFYQKRAKDVGFSNSGRVSYYCSGTLWRTRNWPLDRHSTTTTTHSKGHPGYNIPLHGWFRRVLGNRDSLDAVGNDPYGDLPPELKLLYVNHELPIDLGGSSSKWTDAATIGHALVSSRAVGEPLIYVDLPTDMFGGTFAWDVCHGDSCWDLLARICNRQRGRGSCFLDYEDIAGGAYGTVKLTIRSIPAFVGHLDYPLVDTGNGQRMIVEGTIKGATIGGDSSQAVNVDINGDHRYVDGSFSYDDRSSSVFDYLEVQGEPIQALANLNFYGASLEKRWLSSDETTFGALTLPFQRVSPRWRQVWRRYGIPAAWDYSVTGLPDDDAQCINFYIDESGRIQIADPDVLDETIPANSRMTVRLMPDLPIYEGWNYGTTPPTRWDGSTDTIPPPRMSPLLLYRGDTNAGSDPAWARLESVGFNLQIDDFGLYIVWGPEEVSGYRVLANTTDAPTAYQAVPIAGVTNSAGMTIATKLNAVVGLELGTRVRIAHSAGEVLEFGEEMVPGVGYLDAGRRMTLTVNGLSLWLGAPGAIWELDYSRAAQANYSPGLKFPIASSPVPTILRDDRDFLAQIAALAWSYFGSVHNPGTWELKDCGFLSSFTANGGTMSYPTLGQFVGAMTYSGIAGDGTFDRKADLQTPITCVDYDHDRCVTSWRTDYVRYDVNEQ